MISSGFRVMTEEYTDEKRLESRERLDELEEFIAEAGLKWY